jgi:formate--tetrahydrofolate ligase
MKSDIEINQTSKKQLIKSVAKKVGIPDHYLFKYGNYKAKIDLRVESKFANKQQGKLILVTAVTPTPSGEGKTTVTIGLGDALNTLKKNTLICLREPSMGPVFGLKGGATGGGFAQVVPMEDINLHFTGDMHAISSATNLIAAIVDNSIYQGNELNIDPENILFHRVVDMNDRSLREITIGQGAKINGIERKEKYDITVAGEIMAILCLSKDLNDLKTRIGKIIVAFTYSKHPVTVNKLGITDSVVVLLKDAINPNIVQTLENNPVLIHGGPFANIAHGCNSLIATNLALKASDYVVTEAGFAADLGAEKFFDIKCRIGNLKPSAVVLVCTIRALKMHGGVKKTELGYENLQALTIGFDNLKQHYENLLKFGVQPVIAVNKFLTDTNKEIELILKWAKKNNFEISVVDSFLQGGKGSIDLANIVLKICDQPNNFKYLYDLKRTIKEKINTIATEIYRANGVQYTEQAEADIKRINGLGLSYLPICMAKTQNSFSDIPTLINAPRNFTITVNEVRLSAGAGLIVPINGSILTMPGLPKNPAANNISITKTGKIKGLS